MTTYSDTLIIVGDSGSVNENIAWPVRDNLAPGCVKLMIVYSTNAPQAPCLSLWERWHGERRDGEGVVPILPSQAKIKDFCQCSAEHSRHGSDSPPDCHSLPWRRFAYSQRESQVGKLNVPLPNSRYHHTPEWLQMQGERRLFTFWGRTLKKMFMQIRKFAL